jgi:hypothetical protein
MSLERPNCVTGHRPYFAVNRAAIIPAPRECGLDPFGAGRRITVRVIRIAIIGVAVICVVIGVERIRIIRVIPIPQRGIAIPIKPGALRKPECFQTPKVGLWLNSAVYGLNGHRLYYIISLF